MRLLADTHILLRWLFAAGKLTRSRAQALDLSLQRTEPVGVSAVSLVEIAILGEDQRLKLPRGIDEFFDGLERNPVLQILPITVGIASDLIALAPLRDPMDRVIAATARCHRLKLVTSDQRLIASGLVPVIE